MDEPRVWTITVCPECGEHRPFSAMDAIHGMEPRCSCHGLAEDEEGVIVGSTGPQLVAKTVVAVDSIAPLLERVIDWLDVPDYTRYSDLKQAQSTMADVKALSSELGGRTPDGA